MRAAACWMGVVVSFAMACGGDSGGGSASTTSKLIGPEGGSVELADGAKVVIPPNALATPVRIEITKLELDDVAGLQEAETPAGKPYAFKPHGTMFAQAVKIDLPFEDNAARANPMKLADEADPTWETVAGGTTDTTTKKLSFDTTSFSVFLAVAPHGSDGSVPLDSGRGDAATTRDAATDAPITSDSGTGIDAAITIDAGVDAATMMADAGGLPPGIEAYIKASNAEAGDQFGFAVAMSGDTLVVGAYFEGSNATGINGDQSDNSAPGAGAVYVFVRSGTTWTQQAYLKASNAESGDYFGEAVAIDGDTLVVGARTESSAATGVNGDETNNASTHSGAVYVFTRTGSTWRQEAYLKASNTDATVFGDYFGWSVAVDGDTIAVGAYQEDSDGTDETNNRTTDSGAVYVFVRTIGVWSQQAYLKASNPRFYGYFGRNVALSGDILAVGADGDASTSTGIDGAQTTFTANNSGAVSIFTRSSGAWSYQTYIKASNAEAGDAFGGLVALSGNTLVVGAYGEDSNAVGINGDDTNNTSSNSGAAYVFVTNGSTWSQQAYLKASNSNPTDNFGVSVAIDGDTIVIGAEGEDGSGIGVGSDELTNGRSASGAAYRFTRNGTAWTQDRYMKASASRMSYHLGRAVAVSGDSVIGGAYDEANSATGINGNPTLGSAIGAGAVYVFR